MNCVVCEHSGLKSIYTSTQDVSITSLSKMLSAKTSVHFCPSCGHLYTEPAIDLDAYYDQSYNINSASEDEDQLYAIVDGKPVCRSEHQTQSLMNQLDIPRAARVLDYGCGPAHTTRALAKQRKDLALHLFDVSKNYKPSWLNWLNEAQTACYTIPENWMGSFDLVTSFFALEHVDNPRTFVDTLYALLKPGGSAYLLIPNTYQNVADMIVVDHINHFSETSLRWLLEYAGFAVQYLSDTDHESAWTVVAKRPESGEHVPTQPTAKQINAIDDQAQRMAEFWTQSDARIAAFEAEHKERPATIYGSGFYGCYLFTRLSDPSRVQGFVDRNPHQQAKKLFGRSIADPTSLPDEDRVVWVGLNPRIARQAISELTDWRDRPYTYFYF